MANIKVNYSEKIESLLAEMPDFITDFIYNFGSAQNYATKFEYCKDIKDFFRFIVGFLPEHSEKAIKDITLDDLEKLQPLSINRYLTILAGDENSGCKPSTVKRRRATLSSMYSFFVNNRQLSINPVLATQSISLPEKNVIYLKNEEQSRLLDIVRSGADLGGKSEKEHRLFASRDSALFLLLLDSGLRVSEMLNTNIKDYDLEECCVVVIRKGGDIDTVYFSDECAYYLKEYFDLQLAKYGTKTDKIPAFTTTTGTRLGVRAVETLVKKYMTVCMPEKAKLISPHKLRSSFAMSFYEASGNNILLLQKKLHHKNIQTTNIYARATAQEMKETRCLLEGKR